MVGIVGGKMNDVHLHLFAFGGAWGNRTPSIGCRSNGAAEPRPTLKAILRMTVYYEIVRCTNVQPFSLVHAIIT